MTPDFTPKFDGKSRCLTCRRAQVTHGTRFCEDLIFCHNVQPARLMPPMITECTSYDDKRIPALWDMEQVAWRLCTDLKGRKIGFLSPQAWAEKQNPPAPRPTE